MARIQFELSFIEKLALIWKSGEDGLERGARWTIAKDGNFPPPPLSWHSLTRFPRAEEEEEEEEEV